jgi:DNA topoisomerase I
MHPIPIHNAKVARQNGLRYVSEEARGIRRRRFRKVFLYHFDGDRPVRSIAILKRIRTLAIPPAWKDVWICTDSHGHLQATGRDARGRKQYIYHPKWIEARSLTKYDRLAAFGQRLGKLRRRVERDLRRRGLDKAKVIAAVVRLLDTTAIRIGNDSYTKQNGSFGLTTLRNRHVKVRGDKLRFEFKGKSGVEHAVDLKDRRLAKIVRSCQELPGQEIFRYCTADGMCQTVRSDDINEYLREVFQESFTAKDFRTWSGTVLMAKELSKLPPFTSAPHAKRNINFAVEQVAKRLGNTKSVCQKSYVHPAVIQNYLDGAVGRIGGAGHGDRNLTAAERRALAILVSWRPAIVASEKKPTRVQA